MGEKDGKDGKEEGRKKGKKGGGVGIEQTSCRQERGRRGVKVY